MIKAVNEQKCMGCGVCSLECPQKCITMKENRFGFYEPTVDKALCVDCGKCDKVCPSLNFSTCISDKNKAFAAWTGDNNVRNNSSSGGVFTALSEKVFDNKGVVYGVEFDNNFVAQTVGVENVSDLSCLRGSKYVQANLFNSLPKLKADLEEGKQVLFSGVPCQIAAVHSYLNKDYNNLLLVQVACHGVPSPLVWQKYIEYLEKSNGAEMLSYSFRSKVSGWHNYSIQAKFSDNSDFTAVHSDDLFMKLFLSNIDLNECCYGCPFKSNKSAADITLADFWNIKNVCSRFDDDGGTSLVIIHSDKGEKAFEKSDIKTQEVDYREALKGNSAITSSSARNPKKDEFFTELLQSEFIMTAEKFTKQTISDKFSVFARRVKNHLK